MRSRCLRAPYVQGQTHNPRIGSTLESTLAIRPRGDTGDRAAIRRSAPRVGRAPGRGGSSPRVTSRRRRQPPRGPCCVVRSARGPWAVSGRGLNPTRRRSGSDLNVRARIRARNLHRPRPSPDRPRRPHRRRPRALPRRSTRAPRPPRGGDHPRGAAEVASVVGTRPRVRIADLAAAGRRRARAGAVRGAGRPRRDGEPHAGRHRAPRARGHRPGRAGHGRLVAAASRSSPPTARSRSRAGAGRASFGVTVLYVRDPDRNVIELIERPRSSSGAPAP